MQRTQRRQIEELRFEGLNYTTGYAFPPPGDAKTSMLNAIVQGAIRGMEKLDNAALAVSNDSTLSPTGRAQKLKPDVATAQNVLDDARGRIRMERDVIAAVRAKLYAPPKLDPADVVGVTEDVEIRAWFRGVSPGDLPGVLDGQTSEDLQRILVGVMRGPIRTRERDMAYTLWQERIDRTQKDAVATLDQRDELVGWAASAVAGLQSAMSAANNFGIGGGTTNEPSRAVAPA